MNVPQVSASLTFTTLLALVPLFTVTVVVIAAFPMFGDISDKFNTFITSVITPSGAETVSTYLLQFRHQAGNLTAIGIIMMMVTSLLLVQTIERTFNQIWRVRQARPLTMRVLVYWTLLTLGPLVLGFGLSAWGFLMSHADFTADYPVISKIVQLFSSIGFITILLFLLYKIVPFRFVPTPHALFGAVLTALIFELVRSGFGLYVKNFNSYQLVYGTFAAVPVFLLWLHLLWMILLSGAVFTAALSYWQDEAFRRTFHRGGRFEDVLKILLLLNQAQKEGKGFKIQQFRKHINLGFDELGDLLTKLAAQNYVVRGQDGWVLKTDSNHIELDTLFQQFVYSPSSIDDTVAVHIKNLMHRGIEDMNISLADFAATIAIYERAV